MASGRFTPEEDAYLIREWRAGTTAKRMRVELQRERSSVSNRVKYWQKKGVLNRRPRFGNKREMHLRIDPVVSDKIEVLAAARGRTLSKFVEFILRSWVPT